MAFASINQASVGGGSSNALAIQSDGIFMPRLSTGQRTALALTTGDTGLTVYDFTLKNLFIWNGTAWESIPSSGDAGVNGAVQYNDNGIVSGASNFIYNNATGLVSLASATISGALTVDTTTLVVDAANNRVGIGTPTPGVRVDILSDSNTSLAAVLRVNSNNAAVNTALAYDGLIANGGMTLQTGASPFIINTNGANERYRIANDGVATWSNVGGIAGTAMTLNATGLGVGVSPTAGRLHVKAGVSQNPLVLDTFLFNQIILKVNGSDRGQINADATNCFGVVDSTNSFTRFNVTDTGNVGIGVTAFGTSAVKVLGLANATAPSTSPAGMGQLYVESGALKFRGSSGTVTTIAAA